MARHVSTATLTLFLPDKAKANGAAVVVAGLKMARPDESAASSYPKPRNHAPGAMNFSPALLLVGCLAAAAAGESTAPRSPMRTALSAGLTSRYRYSANADPAATPAGAAPVEAPVVRMAPVVVVGDARFRELDAALEGQLQAIKAGESWSESPTILLRGRGLLPQVEIRVTPHDRDKGFDFLRVGFSW